MLLVGCLVACGSNDSQRPDTTGTSSAAVTSTDDAAVANPQPRQVSPMVKTKQDIETYDQQVVDVVGTYEVDDIGRRRVTSKMADGTELQSNKVVYIKLEDGGDIRVGARPDDERAQLANKKVVARGKIVKDPPRDERAAQMAPVPELVDVESIAAAD